MEGLGKLAQVAVIVRNIEEAAEKWAKLLGVEKPRVVETAEWEETHMMYRGAPSRGRAKLAFFDLGGVTLELIEPIGGPSTWSEFLERHGGGIHHVAFVVDDVESAVRALQDLGGELVQRGDFEGGSYAYVDARGSLGAIIELLTFKKR